MLSSAIVKAKALELGFSLVGISGDLATKHNDFYRWWLGQGYAAEMHYLHFQKQRRSSFRNILPEANSIVVCALAFPGPTSATEVAEAGEPRGKVARYAWGSDYHERLQEKLTELAKFIDTEAGIPKLQRSLAYVDTGALPERAYASQAGLGWIGKNAMLIHPDHGSWFWLGEVITTAVLEPDIPAADRCGSCRRCIDACPTDAIIEGARAIDSRKCISYLTIEHRGPVPEKFHAPIGDWLLGCDICQEVCPWNHRSLRAGRAQIGEPTVEFLNLNEISALEKAEFKSRFAERAISRAKVTGLKRNAAIVRQNLERSAEKNPAASKK